MLEFRLFRWKRDLFAPQSSLALLPRRPRRSFFVPSVSFWFKISALLELADGEEVARGQEPTGACDRNIFLSEDLFIRSRLRHLFRASAVHFLCRPRRDSFPA